MDHPDIGSDLDGIDDPVGIASMPQSQLGYARSGSFEGFGDSG